MRAAHSLPLCPPYNVLARDAGWAWIGGRTTKARPVCGFLCESNKKKHDRLNDQAVGMESLGKRGVNEHCTCSSLTSSQPRRHGMQKKKAGRKLDRLWEPLARPFFFPSCLKNPGLRPSSERDRRQATQVAQSSIGKTYRTPSAI